MWRERIAGDGIDSFFFCLFFFKSSDPRPSEGTSERVGGRGG